MTIIVGTDIIIHLAMEIIHFTDEREKKKRRKRILNLSWWVQLVYIGIEVMR
jgi:hypothetical protein